MSKRRSPKPHGSYGPPTRRPSRRRRGGPRRRPICCASRLRYRDHAEAVAARHARENAQRRSLRRGGSSVVWSFSAFKCSRCRGHHLMRTPRAAELSPVRDGDPAAPDARPVAVRVRPRAKGWEVVHAASARYQSTRIREHVASTSISRH